MDPIVTLPRSTLPLFQRCLRSSWLHILLSVGIVALDWWSGPNIRFPILYVVPVLCSSWYTGTWLSYGLAVVLPICRVLTIELADTSEPPAYIWVNTGVRIALLLLLAVLVRRVRAQTQRLEKQVAELVRICAWSRTVEYEGKWISFEEYLKRRFHLDTSHGISPAEAEKFEREHGGSDDGPSI